MRKILEDLREACAVTAWNAYMDACRTRGLNPSTMEGFLVADQVRGTVLPEIGNLMQLCQLLASAEPLEIYRGDEWDTLRDLQVAFKDAVDNIEDIRVIQPMAHGAERYPLLARQVYYTPDLLRDDRITDLKWVGSDNDLRRLERGLVHLTAKGASDHAGKMLNVPE